MIDLTISEQHKQKLLHRTRVSGRLSYPDVIPSRIEVRKLLANKLGTKEDVVIVHQILPGFGVGVAKVHADVYDTADVMPRLVDTFTRVRHLPKEEKVKFRDELKAKRQAAKAAKQAAKKAGK